LLRFGQIRPVQRSVAKLLYRVSFNYTLKQIIEARAEDQWELWSLIELLTLSGFDPQSLWVAQPGENRHICNIVQPLRFRMYSISSATEDSGQRDVQELHLTVGRLSYKTKNTTLSMESEQAGTCSHFLGETAIAHLRKDDRVSFQIVHPPRFGLPQAPDTPIVMFAGGTGLAPFRGFLEARAKQAGGGENWLFFGTRSSNDLYYMEEFASIAASGRLHIRVALSREDATVAFDAGKSRFVVQPGKRARINDVILSEENARLLWDLLRSREDGGKGARFYVCGRTDFANTIMASIKSVLLRYSEGSEQQKHEKVRKKLYRLAAEGNYLQDIFTTYSGSHIEKKQLYNASDVVMHNSEEQGYWIIINGLVYDVSEFSHMHPGGFMIIRGYAGMDGTHAYEKVLHHTNSEVDALLGMYEIGAVRRLDFGSEWSVAIGRSAQQNAFIRHDGLFFITLADIYRLWVRFLYQVVELENTLHNGFTIQHTVLTRNDAADEWSPLKIQYMIETHRHFIEDHISCIADFLQDVWIVTSGMCSTALDVRWMANTLDTLQQTEGARATMQLHEKLLHSQLDAASENPTDNVRTDWLVECCTQLEIDDKQCINAVKLALRDGVKVFEAFERDTPRKGNARLLAVIQSMPQVLEDYYRRVSGQALFAGLD
jgi:sulfite reductase (NADPH) flavoprotein alpha-component